MESPVPEGGDMVMVNPLSLVSPQFSALKTQLMRTARAPIGTNEMLSGGGGRAPRQVQHCHRTSRNTCAGKTQPTEHTKKSLHVLAAGSISLTTYHQQSCRSHLSSYTPTLSHASTWKLSPPSFCVSWNVTQSSSLRGRKTWPLVK